MDDSMYLTVNKLANGDTWHMQFKQEPIGSGKDTQDIALSREQYLSLCKALVQAYNSSAYSSYFKL